MTVPAPYWGARARPAVIAAFCRQAHGEQLPRFGFDAKSGAQDGDDYAFKCVRGRADYDPMLDLNPRSKLP